MGRSAYQEHTAKMMRQGFTMAQAAAEWRKMKASGKAVTKTKGGAVKMKGGGVRMVGGAGGKRQRRRSSSDDDEQIVAAASHASGMPMSALGPANEQIGVRMRGGAIRMAGGGFNVVNDAILPGLNVAKHALPFLPFIL